MAKLLEDDVNKKLEEFDNWIYANNSISKEYEFKDFVNTNKAIKFFLENTT